MIKACLRLLCRYRWIPIAVCAPVCAVVVLWTALVEGPLLFMVGFSLLVLLFAVMMSEFAGGQLIAFALRDFYKSCDPQPLLEEAEAQLAMMKNKRYRSALKINQGVAKIHLGQYAEALTEMEMLDLKAFGRIPMASLIYYYNLTVAALLAKDGEKAEAYYRQTEACFPCLRDKEQRAAVQRELSDLYAWLLIYQGKADEALVQLPNYAEDDAYHKVRRAFILAQVALAKEEKSLARAQLRMVAVNGNRLYFAALAEQTLDQMD